MFWAQLNFMRVVFLLKSNVKTSMDLYGLRGPSLISNTDELKSAVFPLFVEGPRFGLSLHFLLLAETHFFDQFFRLKG